MQNRNPAIAKVLNVLVFLFLYLPIAVLIIFSFNDSKSRTVWSGFSLHWYQELFQDEEILSAFSTTLTVSVLAAPALLSTRWHLFCRPMHPVSMNTLSIIRHYTPSPHAAAYLPNPISSR